MSRRQPPYAMIRGKRYVLCAALVNTSREGAPSNLTLLRPRASVELAGGEEFITLYVPERVLPSDWLTREAGEGGDRG